MSGPSITAGGAREYHVASSESSSGYYLYEDEDCNAKSLERTKAWIDKQSQMTEATDSDVETMAVIPKSVVGSEPSSTSEAATDGEQSHQDGERPSTTSEENEVAEPSGAHRPDENVQIIRRVGEPHEVIVISDDEDETEDELAEEIPRQLTPKTVELDNGSHRVGLEASMRRRYETHGWRYSPDADTYHALNRDRRARRNADRTEYFESQTHTYQHEDRRYRSGHHHQTYEYQDTYHQEHRRNRPGEFHQAYEYINTYHQEYRRDRFRGGHQEYGYQETYYEEHHRDNSGYHRQSYEHQEYNPSWNRQYTSRYPTRHEQVSEHFEPIYGAASQFHYPGYQPEYNHLGPDPYMAAAHHTYVPAYQSVHIHNQRQQDSFTHYHQTSYNYYRTSHNYHQPSHEYHQSSHYAPLQPSEAVYTSDSRPRTQYRPTAGSEDFSGRVSENGRTPERARRLKREREEESTENEPGVPKRPRTRPVSRTAVRPQRR